MSNDATRLSRLPGPFNTTPNVQVSASSGTRFGLPLMFSFSSGKNGLPGRAKLFACGAARSTEVRRRAADDVGAKRLHLQSIRVCRDVAPRRERRVRARIAGREGHGGNGRARIQLGHVRCARRELETAAKGDSVGRGEVEQRLPGISHRRTCRSPSSGSRTRGRGAPPRERAARRRSL